MGQSLVGGLKESVGAVGYGFVNLSSGFSALYSLSPDCLPAPSEPKDGSVCPGFGQRSCIVKTWSCNWTWRHPEPVAGEPKGDNGCRARDER